MIDFDAIWRCQDEVRTEVNSSGKREQRNLFFCRAGEESSVAQRLSWRPHLEPEL